MNRNRWHQFYFVALVGLLFMQSAKAEEANFRCGNLLDVKDGLQSNLGYGLAKSSQLPAPVKIRTGKLKALIIRVSFADGPYLIDTSVINKTNLTINSLFASMSRNTFQWDFKIHPTILNAPGLKTAYATNFSSLQSWLAGQISAAGLKRGIDYDVYIANFPSLPLAWAGLSNMREADWINGNYSATVTAHELGHSLGLPHAHSIEAGPEMIGVPGVDTNTNEYGNPYDVMGHGGNSSHFNVLYKLQVGWEDPEEIKEIKTSGIYRIYAHDNALHKSRLIGMRVPSTNPNYAYWFEYRSLSTSARNGASVLFQGFKSATNLETWYVDTTPGSKISSDETDGVLAPGKQFMDKYGPITFKTLAINANTWNEEGWVDVQVTIPGVKVIEAMTKNRAWKNEWASDQPMFNLLGRSVEINSRQTLVVRTDSDNRNLSLLAR